MPPHPSATPSPSADWRSAGLYYYSLAYYFRRTFDQPIWKVSVDAGLGCPHASGPGQRGGCVFCDAQSFSPSRAPASITRQIAAGIAGIQRTRKVQRFIAYFQPGSNTNAPVAQLRAAYEEALACPGVVGLAIGTRPDCLADDVLDLLADLSGRTWLSLELGLQSIHDRSLEWMNRGHDYAAFLQAVARSRQRGLRVGAHVILGLPGESADDMRATAREINRLGIDSVKLHNLHAVRKTPLADWVTAGRVRLPTLDEYVGFAVDLLERIGSECVVERLSGDAPPEYLVGPAWCLDKARVKAAIEAELERRQSWQGRLADCPTPRRGRS